MTRSTIRRTAATTILALATTAGLAAASGTVKDGLYKGKASLFPLSFHVSGAGKNVTAFKLSYEITTCGAPGSDVAPTYLFPTMRIVHGAFSGELKKSSGPREKFGFTVSGKIGTDGAATGHGVATDKITSLPTCTEKFTFTAKLE
jgi:hypothetical protein